MYMEMLFLDHLDHFLVILKLLVLFTFVLENITICSDVRQQVAPSFIMGGIGRVKTGGEADVETFLSPRSPLFQARPFSFLERKRGTTRSLKSGAFSSSCSS